MVLRYPGFSSFTGQKLLVCGKFWGTTPFFQMSILLQELSSTTILLKDATRGPHPRPIDRANAPARTGTGCDAEIGRRCLLGDGRGGVAEPLDEEVVLARLKEELEDHA